MVFNSVIFIFCFLPFVIISYLAVPIRFKKHILLLSGLCFYLWSGLNNIKFILLLLIVNYLGALFIKKYRKKIVLILLIGFNIGLLIYSKYFNYLIDNLNAYLSLEIPLTELVIPLGISFIVFHTISYQIDCYQNASLYNGGFLDFSIYILYFPKLIQGPIILYKDFVCQLKNPDINLNHFTHGVERFIIGLAKKVIFADTLFIIINQAIEYMHLYGIDVYTYWLIAFVYFWVIYLDFSGYSDMSLGISDMMGFSFSENFHFPYSACSITDFWRRWHISLGTWFRNYVYIPLGGNRNGNVYLHLLIVFVLTGMWHGAGVWYLLWGVLHGTVILIERFLMKRHLLDKLPSLMGWCYTMLVVMFGWLIFLFPHANKLIPFLKGMCGLVYNDYIPFSITYILSFKTAVTLMITIVLTYLTSNFTIRRLYNKYDLNSKFFNCLKYIILSILFLYSIMGIVSGNYNPFIYFQF